MLNNFKAPKEHIIQRELLIRKDEVLVNNLHCGDMRKLSQLGWLKHGIDLLNT